MASCEYCGDATGEFAFECDYCGAAFCHSHRLPEAHDCTNISNARPPTSTAQEADAFTDWSRGAKSADEIDLQELRERAEQEKQPYSVVEVEQTVGTRPEPDFESSPDVATDGSVASEGNSNESTTNRQEVSRYRSLVLFAAILIVLLLIGIVLLWPF